MPIRYAVLGFGNVGSAVIRLGRQESSRLRLNMAAGELLELARILVRNPDKSRDLLLPGYTTTDFGVIVGDPSIKIVVSLIGDTEAEFNYCLAALEAGKAVVTANKVMIAKYGPALFAAAARAGVPLLFEAAIGGGIPIVDALVSGRMIVNDITSVRAIINGTTNFMLTAMDGGADYADSLREAQRLGYAEPEPSFDVEGRDASFKLAVLASLTFGGWVNVSQIPIEGITQLSERDFWFASQLGYTIKHIAAAGWNSQGELDLWVAPMLVKKIHHLASVGGVTNAIMFIGTPIGEVVFQGPGAGGDPTAASVWSDVVKAAKSLATGQPILLPTFTNDIAVCHPGDSEGHWAIRLVVKDEVGVTFTISGVLAYAGISIDEMLQPREAKKNGEAEVVFTTDLAKWGAVLDAVNRIGNLSICSKVTSVLRVIP